jgi:hypothetical protein
MLDSCTIVERLPTVEEYVRLIAAVGFRPRQREAIALALQHSWFSVCAESEGEAVGMGRVIGDGGLHLYLTQPASQDPLHRCAWKPPLSRRVYPLTLDAPPMALSCMTAFVRYAISPSA